MNRRLFLAASAGGFLCFDSARASVPEWEKPLFQLHKQIASPVKIKSIEVLYRDKNYFVRTTSTEGAAGVVVAKDPIQDYFPILFRRVAPAFIGKDARDIEALVDGVYQQHYKLAGQPFWLPVGAVEQSIWDLLGRVARKPVSELMGGMLKKEIPIYLSGSGRDTTAEEEVDVYVRSVEETGAKAVKFKIGGRMSRNVDTYPGRTETLLKLARKRLGDNMILHADANGSYDAQQGIEVGKLLQDLKFGFYEEPCPWEEISETKKVADALDIKIAVGEQDASLWRFNWMMETGVFQIVQPDLNYNGGFIRAARVARIARKFGIPITPHNTQTGPASSKILHFAAAIPNAGEHMEYPHRAPAKPQSWYSPNFKIKDGKIAVPSGPGLGVDFDPKYLESAKLITAD